MGRNRGSLLCFILLPAACAVCVLFSGCKLITSLPSHQVIYKSPSLTLQWDPPPDDFLNSPHKVTSYIIYYRDYEAPSWRVLDIIPATGKPQYTVKHDQLGDGAFVFAVQSISESSGRSAIHTSLDSSADPICGWYVLWVKSE